MVKVLRAIPIIQNLEFVFRGFAGFYFSSINAVDSASDRAIFQRHLFYFFAVYSLVDFRELCKSRGKVVEHVCVANGFLNNIVSQGDERAAYVALETSTMRKRGIAYGARALR